MVPSDEQKKKINEAKTTANQIDDGFCSTAQFRRRLIKANFRLFPDQDVLHIIASANGGADHVDNYVWLGNRVLNIRLGKNNDHIYCYLAGKAAAEAAVAISKIHGNRKGIKYTGKSGEDLYRSGEAVMRTATGKAHKLHD